jgi:hypothetical protein
MAVHRIARMRQETVALTVERLLRIGVRRYKRTMGTDDFADLPHIGPLRPRPRRRKRSIGVGQVVQATVAETMTTIATAELVREALQEHGDEEETS